MRRHNGIPEILSFFSGRAIHIALLRPVFYRVLTDGKNLLQPLFGGRHLCALLHRIVACLHKNPADVHALPRKQLCVAESLVIIRFQTAAAVCERPDLVVGAVAAHLVADAAALIQFLSAEDFHGIPRASLRRQAQASGDFLSHIDPDAAILIDLDFFRLDALPAKHPRRL